jgi:hypothetical protein
LCLRAQERTPAETGARASGCPRPAASRTSRTMVACLTRMPISAAGPRLLLTSRPEGRVRALAAGYEKQGRTCSTCLCRIGSPRLTRPLSRSPRPNPRCLFPRRPGGGPRERRDYAQRCSLDHDRASRWLPDPVAAHLPTVAVADLRCERKNQVGRRCGVACLRCCGFSRVGARRARPAMGARCHA